MPIMAEISTTAGHVLAMFSFRLGDQWHGELNINQWFPFLELRKSTWCLPGQWNKSCGCIQQWMKWGSHNQSWPFCGTTMLELSYWHRTLNTTHVSNTLTYDITIFENMWRMATSKYIALHQPITLQICLPNNSCAPHMNGNPLPSVYAKEFTNPGGLL